VAGTIAGLVACDSGEADESQQTPEVAVVINTPLGSVTPRARKTPTPSPTATATPLQVCAPNPDPASPKVLQVEEPQKDAQVSIPVHVRGWGSNIGQDNRGVTLAVVDQKQAVLQVVNLPPLPREFRVAPQGMEITEFTRPFAADVVLQEVKEPTPYCIWIYQETTPEGRARGVVQIPVILKPRP
jgi:hypothetical protein